MPENEMRGSEMPDSEIPNFRLLVHERLGMLKPNSAQREEIIAELAGHLEEVYEVWCAKGMCKYDALQRSLEQEEIDWRRLSRKIQSAKCEEGFMNDRTRQCWLPALTSLAISEGMLFAISITVATHARLWQLGAAAMYVPWLLSLPAAGAAGAYLVRRSGAQRKALLAAVLFPAFVGLAFICGGLLITLTMGVRVFFAKPEWFYISLALVVGVLIPCIALWLGSLPFLREHGSASAEMNA
jgi:hypothetical protein